MANRCQEVPQDAGRLHRDAKRSPCCVGMLDGLSLLPAVEMLELLPDVGLTSRRLELLPL